MVSERRLSIKLFKFKGPCAQVQASWEWAAWVWISMVQIYKRTNVACYMYDKTTHEKTTVG